MKIMATHLNVTSLMKEEEHEKGSATVARANKRTAQNPRKFWLRKFSTANKTGRK